MAENWLSSTSGITETANFSKEAAMIIRKVMAISITAAASFPILRIIYNFQLKSTGVDDSSSDYHVEVDDHNLDSLELQCVICLCGISSGETFRVLSECDHGFHVDCIDVWLQENSTCPLCRCPVPYTSVKQRQLNHERPFFYHLYDAILSCFLALTDHLCTWFVDPLGLERIFENNLLDINEQDLYL